MSVKKRYWLVYIAAGIFLLATALYYQYFLETLPCVLCIHIRLWVSLFVLLSILGLVLRHSKWMNPIMNMSIVLVAVALTERSYQLLGTERGFVFGDCGFDLGLPVWLALDKWMPWLYQVETSCGYTPEILFGITMSEVLIVLSGLLLLLSTGVFILSLIRNK